MPTSDRLELDLRPATLDDVGIVADLEATRDPEDPRDPEMLRFWWTRGSANEVYMRLVSVRQGEAVAFVGAGHERWEDTPKRFGWIRPVIHRDLWSDAGYSDLVSTAEAWLRSESAATAVVRVREDRKNELEILDRIGYREVRRQKCSELDLGAAHDGLLAGAERCRRRMRDEGVSLLTLSEDTDPKRLNKLYEVCIEVEKDIPTTVPWRTMPFDEWKPMWFEDPGIREDRFWIAREGDAVVGLSVIGFPPTRGLPWTWLTGTSRAVRGRGIARALKYETMAQAIELGYQRVRTNNDGANAPILHINQEMGYRLVAPLIELHRELE
ncbi:MAG TPA: GNAT family N-acetyltransferase [Candidatus Dormibacteraeota bacterium]